MTIYEQGESAQDASEKEKQYNLCEVIEQAKSSKIIITRKDIAEFTGYSPKTVDEYIDNFAKKSKACGYITIKQKLADARTKGKASAMPKISSDDVLGNLRAGIERLVSAREEQKNEEVN